jgi:hypothetical protein
MVKHAVLAFLLIVAIGWAEKYSLPAGTTLYCRITQPSAQISIPRVIFSGRRPNYQLTPGLVPQR